MVEIAFGYYNDSVTATLLKAYLAEFIATLVFVFAGVGSAIADNKITSDAALDPAGLVGVAVAHGFALFVGVSMAANISGGHFEYSCHLWIGCWGPYNYLDWFLLLDCPIAWLHYCLPSPQICDSWIVYATAADPKKGSANILAAGPFSGGSMNPARSFGPTVVAGDFSQNWIYWVGPLIGGGLAGLIYGDVFMIHFQSLKTA
ncbi:Aquaporin TIP2-3 [Capsicum chinense]|nr:Aquaporin TIP2-3 [Capsicum chinense]